MKKISFKYIIAAYIFVLAFLICLVSSFTRLEFYFAAGLCLLVYIIIDKKFLRCPNCGSYINLDRLSYAKNHDYHCHNCGKKIEID